MVINFLNRLINIHTKSKEPRCCVLIINDNIIRLYHISYSYYINTDLSNKRLIYKWNDITDDVLDLLCVILEKMDCIYYKTTTPVCINFPANIKICKLVYNEYSIYNLRYIEDLTIYNLGKNLKFANTLDNIQVLNIYNLNLKNKMQNSIDSLINILFSKIPHLEITTHTSILNNIKKSAKKLNLNICDNGINTLILNGTTYKPSDILVKSAVKI
jgi:hypothetical protein